MRKKTGIIAGVFGIVMLCVAVLAIIIVQKYFSNSEKEYVLQKNVYSIETGSAEYNAIESIDADSIVSNSDLKRKVGDIIAFGTGDKLENGGIYKITDVDSNGPEYIYSIEYASLNDVYKEAHIHKQFLVTEDKAEEISESDDTETIVSMLLGSETVYAYDIPISYPLSINEDIGSGATLTGNADFNWILSIDLDIKIGEPDYFSISLKEIETGKLVLECKNGITKSFSKDLAEVKLPTIEFWFGIPIVITNKVTLSVEAEAELSASFTITADISKTSETGFEYVDGRIVEITPTEYDSDGIEHEATTDVSGSASAGVYVHYIAKLYGLAGPDFSAGLEANAKAELKTSLIKENQIVGTVEMALTPKLKGQLVFDCPILNIEPTELFSHDFDSIWEYKWEQSDDIIEDESRNTESDIAKDSEVEEPDGLYGIDWVYDDEIKFKQGEQFISGRGISYRIETVEDTPAGRTNLYLEDEYGNSRRILGIPNFSVDSRNNKIYYTILEN